MTSRQTDCPVCGHPGFERAALPQICPQCGWSVENLLEPSKAYLRKLNEAKEKWLADGETQVRAKRLVALFEQIDAAWKAGRWTEVMGCYDEIQSIHPDNARASRERPVALFCLMESLLQQYSDTRRKVLQQQLVKDERSRDNLQAEARKFESVGMAVEADESLEKTAELDRRIQKNDTVSKALAELTPAYYTTVNMQSGPWSFPRDLQMDAASLLSLPDPKWTDKRFDELLLQPFFRQISALPAETRRYALEFQEACKKAVSEVRLREEKARKALDEARRMIDCGSYPRAEECLTEALTLDPSLSNEIGLMRSDLTKRLQAAKDHEKQQRRAAEERVEEDRRVAERLAEQKRQAEIAREEIQRRHLAGAGKWVLIMGGVLIILLILVWVWSNLIVPFFGHIIWQPFSWAWYLKLPVGLLLAFAGAVLSLTDDPFHSLAPRIACGIFALYGAALVISWVFLFITRDLWQPFKWEWYYRLFFGVILSFIGFGLSAAADDSPPMLFIGIPILLYGLALLIILVGSFLGWLFGWIF